MKKLSFALISMLTVFSLSAQNTGKVTDIDGNEYKTVIIGEQEWMAENLKTTRFNDGTGIPVVTGIAWTKLTSPGQSWYGDKKDAYSDTYGALYNWYAISATANGGRNVCPAGWHVPSDEEWTSLENYLVANGYNYDGTKAGNKIAKSLADNAYWASSSDKGAVGNTDYPDKGNATGFSGLPGGYRNYRSPGFGGIEGSAYWWTATGNGEKTAWFRHMYYADGNIHRDYYLKKYGFSVRCVKD